MPPGEVTGGRVGRLGCGLYYDTLGLGLSPDRVLRIGGKCNCIRGWGISIPVFGLVVHL